MSESIESVHLDQPSEVSPPAVAAGVPGQTSPSVRELLAELAQLEDATRGLGGVRRPIWAAQPTDLPAALAREQEIIDELHRRCPEGRHATGAPDDVGVADRAD